MSSTASQINALERRLTEDRRAVRQRVTSLRRQVRRRATAPSTLLCAVGVGVLVEHGSRSAPRSARGLWRAAVVTTALARSVRDLLTSLDATRPAS